MRSEDEINRVIEEYADLVRRLCMLHLKSVQDSEDIFQEVFIKYAYCSKEFESKEHEKAWIIRVTVNACKDLLKSFFRNNTVSLENVIIESREKGYEYNEVLEQVLRLPNKYKDVVFLFYYEGYTAVDIANILNKNVNTIYTLLSRARNILGEKLRGSFYEE